MEIVSSLALQFRQRIWQMDPADTLMDPGVTSKKSNLYLELVAPGIWFERTSIIYNIKFLIHFIKSSALSMALVLFNENMSS